MSKNVKLVIPIVVGALFVAYLVYSSLNLDQVTCEVCMEFGGRVDCRRASGTSDEEATQTAINNACALLASGRDASISCSRTPPQSVTCEESAVNP